jgi:glycosyltransferase involved in cell wall biosynthesis
MKILVISNNYPSERDPSHGTFVYQLIQQFAKLGHEVTVIRPTYFIPKRFVWMKRSYGEELAKVYRPKYLSTSAKFFFNLNSYRIGENFQIRAVKNIVKKNSIEFDLVYAHFFTNAFIAISALSCYNKPIYAAIGEYYHIDIRRSYYSKKYFDDMIAKIAGFIAVSPQIEQKLLSLGIDKNKITIKPNGVDFKIFYKRDRIEMRKKYGLPLDSKLVIFVGRFVPDKGPHKLLEAIEKMENVGVILAGSGELNLQSEKIVFNNSVSPEKVPELLSAADVFVLPTLHEGSCNAIIEAMACGLPIVSSNIPEIKVQCDPSFSILVDPLNVSELRDAITTIIEDKEKKDTMSSNALLSSRKYNLEERALSIANFIEGNVYS